MLMGDRFPLPINVFTLMETGLYPHPGPSKQPLTVQRGMHIRLHAVNFKRLYASRRAGWLGVVAVVQHQALLLCYDGCRVGCITQSWNGHSLCAVYYACAHSFI